VGIARDLVPRPPRLTQRQSEARCFAPCLSRGVRDRRQLEFRLRECGPGCDRAAVARAASRSSSVSRRATLSPSTPETWWSTRRCSGYSSLFGFVRWYPSGARSVKPSLSDRHSSIGRTRLLGRCAPRRASRRPELLPRRAGSRRALERWARARGPSGSRSPGLECPDRMFRRMPRRQPWYGLPPRSSGEPERWSRRLTLNRSRSLIPSQSPPPNGPPQRPLAP